MISLQHLTSLSLNIGTNSSAISNHSYISLLSHLGNCCPQLADLFLSRELEDEEEEEEHILALFLGQRASLIPSAAKQKMWENDWSSMHKVQRAKEHLSPICFSLVTLSVDFRVDESKDCKFCGLKSHSIKAQSVMAFILRHLPNFEGGTNTHGDSCFCIEFKALLLLYESSSQGLQQEEIEEVFQSDGNPDNSTVGLDLKLTFNCSFSDNCYIIFISIDCV